MTRRPSHEARPRSQIVAQRLFDALERFLHIEAVSGIVLLVSAASALVWANSSGAHFYHEFWELPVDFALGPFAFSQSLHFVVNDVLMSVFFLVVGMEIRREMHDGALAQLRVAALPLAAAVGGVVVPALIFVSLSGSTELRPGWAVPTATDIAFAIGVLSLLGRMIPLSVRVLLLALAIIDDIAAVLIIAFFYGEGIDPSALLIAGAAIIAVLGMQYIGIGNAFAYVAPGAVLWWALLKIGVHPTLAGVILGLITPVRTRPMREPPVEIANRALREIHGKAETRPAPPDISHPLKALREAQRELLPPVVRVQAALHPWVAYGIMPLFALANAGVSFQEVDLGSGATVRLAVSTALALLLGKPLGIFAGSWLAVRAGWCQLPEGASWKGILLVGILGGIGFTMSIFIATLAFSDPQLLSAAKVGVLLSSSIAGILGVLFGYAFRFDQSIR